MHLAVLTCQSATEPAQRHWPSWRAHFEDVVFITTIDSNCWVPEGIEEWRIGRDQYNDRDRPTENLCRRTVNVLKRFLETHHQQIVIIEYDVFIFRKPEPVKEFSGTLFEKFIHCPWQFSRNFAKQYVKVAESLLRQGMISGGWPDQHVRAVVDILAPEITYNHNYTKNTLDHAWMIEEARLHICKGAYAIHGVKSKEQLEALLA